MKMETVSYLNVGGSDYELADKQARSDIGLKADKVELEKVASGSPAGVYANLSELQSAEDVDKTRIYLTLDNGNWNYWNGKLWVSGGLYQAVTVKDNTVTPKKTTYLKNQNLFNADNAVRSNSHPYVAVSAEEETFGKKIEATETKDSETFITSDYIEIEGGQTYEACGYALLFYDENKEFIYGVSAQSNKNNNNPYPFAQSLCTAPKNAVYARISGNANFESSMYLIKRKLYKVYTIEGSDYTNSNVLEGDSESLYKKNYSNLVDIRADNIAQKNIYPEHTTFIKCNNLCNLAQTFRGPRPDFTEKDSVYTETTMAENADMHFWTTDYIEIKPNTKYKAHTGTLFFYDENYNLIKAKRNTTSQFGPEKFNVIDTSPANAKYARLWENVQGRNMLSLVEYDKSSYELDETVFQEIFKVQQQDSGSILENVLPNKFVKEDYGTTLMKGCYFLGRWEKRQLRGTDCVCTGYNGGKIFTKVKDANSITLNFVPPTKTGENFTILYRIDGKDYVKQEISSTNYNIIINNLESRCEHFIEIMINTSSYEINSFKTVNNSAGFIGITTAGTIEQIIPQNKKILFIGDSITAGAYVGAGNNYCAITSRLLRCQDMRIGISGIGILRPWGEYPSVAGKVMDGPTPTSYQYNSYIDYSREGVKEESQTPNLIIVNLGTNDGGYNDEEFKPAFKSVIERLKDKYLGIDIIILQPLNRAKATSIKAVAEETNCIYIDTGSWSDVTFVDGIHPDEEGSKVFGKYLANVLLNYFGKSYFLI